MSMLCIGDIHIEENNRLDDLKKLLHQIVQIVKEKNVQQVRFFGDMFTNRRPTALEYAVAYTFVMELRENCENIILLKGNHDEQKEASTLDGFDILKVSGVRVVENNYIEDGIYMGHYILKEAIVGDSNFHIENAVTLEQLFTRYPNCRAYLFGDIHKPQIVNEKPLVAYIGSVMRNNFGEKNNETRVLLLENNGRIQSIPLNDRPMIQCNFNAEDLLLEAGLQMYPHNFIEAIVKVVISGNEEELKKIDMQQVREFFKSAHSLTIQYDVIKKDIVRDLSITEETTDEDALKSYLNKKRNDLDNQTKNLLYEKGIEVIQLVKEKK